MSVYSNITGISIKRLHVLANDSTTRNFDGQNLGRLVAEKSEENVAVTPNNGELVVYLILPKVTFHSFIESKSQVG